MLSAIKNRLTSHGVDVFGVSTVADWDSPYPECRPTEILEGCRRIIVFGKEISPPLYTAKEHAGDLYAVFSHHCYHDLDAAAGELACELTRQGYPSIPIGSYQPVIVRHGDYRGIISLKHAAVRAGLGTMGKNSLLVHRDFGNRLRLGGVLTTAELPAGTALKESMCPENCRKCVRECPAQALDGKGGIKQYKCLKNCIVQPLLSLNFITRWGRRFPLVNRMAETMTKTMVTSYSYSCYNCLTTCPNFKRGQKVKP